MLGLRFLPEMLMLLTGGMPKLVLIAELAGDDEQAVIKSTQDLKKRLMPNSKLNPESLKIEPMPKNTGQLGARVLTCFVSMFRVKTAPFIDDLIVRPEQLPEFLPRLNAILEPYKNIVYTIAGHVRRCQLPHHTLNEFKQRA